MPEDSESKKPTRAQITAAAVGLTGIMSVPHVLVPTEAQANTPSPTPTVKLTNTPTGPESTKIALRATQTAITDEKEIARLEASIEKARQEAEEARNSPTPTKTSTPKPSSTRVPTRTPNAEATARAEETATAKKEGIATEIARNNAASAAVDKTQTAAPIIRAGERAAQEAIRPRVNPDQNDTVPIAVLIAELGLIGTMGYLLFRWRERIRNNFRRRGGGGRQPGPGSGGGGPGNPPNPVRPPTAGPAAPVVPPAQPAAPLEDESETAAERLQRIMRVWQQQDRR